MVNKKDLEIEWHELDKYICKCVFIEINNIKVKEIVILHSYQNYKSNKIIQVTNVVGKVKEYNWIEIKLYNVMDDEKYFVITGDELFKPDEQPLAENELMHDNKIINELNLLSHAELVELAFGENKLNINKYGLGYENKSQIIDIILEHKK